MENPLWRAVLACLAACVPLAFGIAHAHTGHGGAKPAFDAAHAKETGFGKPADPRRAQRVVEVAMDDTMRYTPATIEVRRGESVRFLVTNRGAAMHEMVLGTRKELARHAEMMRRHPGMEHDEPNMLHVAPGKTGELGWRFTRTGEVHFGCLVPGHLEAGMVGKVVVRE